MNIINWNQLLMNFIKIKSMLEENKREFKGIWIPKEIWLSNKLTLTEKILLAEIDSLEKINGCFASNSYFSKFFNISKIRISQLISSLEEKGFINSELIYYENSKQVKSRSIKINKIKMFNV